MKKVIRLCALILSVLMAVSALTACGSTVSARYNGEEIPAGVYTCFVLDSYSEALSTGKIAEGDDLTKKTIEVSGTDTQAAGTVTAEEYINNKAIENLKCYIEINRRFKELGLELDAAELNYFTNYAKQNYEAQKDMFVENGIGEQSFVSVAADYSLRLQAVFKHTYGVSGTDAVSLSDLSAYLEDNYVMYDYMQFYALDTATGNTALSEDSDEVKSVLDEYKDYMKKAKKGADFAALCKSFGEGDETQRKSGGSGQLLGSKDGGEIYETIRALEIGEFTALNQDNYYCLIRRTAVDDAKSSYANDNRDALVSEMKQAEFLSEALASAESLGIELDRGTIKRFGVAELNIAGFRGMYALSN